MCFNPFKSLEKSVSQGERAPQRDSGSRSSVSLCSWDAAAWPSKQQDSPLGAHFALQLCQFVTLVGARQCGTRSSVALGEVLQASSQPGSVSDADISGLWLVRAEVCCRLRDHSQLLCAVMPQLLEVF